MGILLTLSRFLVAFSEELHGFGCPQWRTKKPLSADILSKLSQYGGVLNVRPLFWSCTVLSFAHTVVLWLVGHVGIPVHCSVHSGSLLCAQHCRNARKQSQCYTSGLGVFLKSEATPPGQKHHTGICRGNCVWIIAWSLFSAKARLSMLSRLQCKSI